MRLRIGMGTTLQKAIILTFALSGTHLAQAQSTILTIAGNGIQGFSGDAGAALSASLNEPYAVAANVSGDFWIADRANHRVRRVSTAGTIVTVAGTGAPGFSGDGGPAVNAQLNDPSGVALDAGGNLYIADASNRRIRRIAANGTITTIAGTGVEGFSGDGGPASFAQLGRPVGVFVAPSGNIIITDSVSKRIRVIRGSDGIIFTVAGTGVSGFSGDGGAAFSAQLNFPIGATADAAGNIFIADAENHRIRMVNTAGVINTVAGSASRGFGGDGGAATNGLMNFPTDVFVDGSGKLFIADGGNNRLRMVSAGVITTVAGTGSDGFSGDGGVGTSARLNYPYRSVVTFNGNILIADTRNHRIRRLSGFGTPPPAPGRVAYLDQPPPPISLVSGAHFRPGVAAGGIVSIFGNNMAGVTMAASTVPLPTSMGDTSVTFNGIAAPLFYVSPGQINAQAPFNVPTGSVTIAVRRGSTMVSAAANISSSSPGIFTMDMSGGGQGAILTSNFTLANEANPARPGEVVQVFLTGLGATSPPVPSGQRAPSAEPFARVTAPVTASIVGIPAEVVFAGLAPGFVGLYQVNVRIPAGVIPGPNSSLVLTQGGVNSNTVTLAIQ